MGLSLYNTLSRRLEPFTPLVPGQVGIYVCGPTVYGPPHLGHAKSYISFDVLVKWLRQSGYKVRYVQNITDVGHLTDDADAGEDKIQKQARLDQVHPLELVDKYMREYMSNMEALHVAHPSMYVRATQHIGEQIEMVQQLLAKGHAYVVDGSVYFDVRSFKDYGKLSGRTLEEAQEGARVEVREDKRDPRDFALWKKAEPNHILQWNSPWGPGFPGWHIECSVMAMKYIGATLDIHGGGLENQFPHHECEIAQSQAVTGKPFCRYWIHNNMVTVDGVKMGKSLGNFKTVADLLSRHRPEHLRAFILTGHYRSPTNYTEEGIAAAAKGNERIERLAERVRSWTGAGEAKFREPVAAAVAKAKAAITEALDSDLNTAAAIAGLHEFASALNREIPAEATPDAETAAAVRDVLTTYAISVLGILAPATLAATGDGTNAGAAAGAGHDPAPFIQRLVELRQEMKAAKRFDLADGIREHLTKNGVTVEDTKAGPRWRFTG